MTELFVSKHLDVSYGKKKVIDDVSFTLKAGDFCGLLGLNGSGKTTILHAACGFLPYFGELCAAGWNLQKLHERKRAKLIAFIPQVSSLTGGRSALDVVLMGFNPWLSLFDLPSAKDRQTAIFALEKLDAGAFAGRDFGTLSQGERQLVILARCLVQNTPILLMDEPDSSLDFLNKHKVLSKIRDVISAERKAGLIALHDPNFALAYCNRLILLHEGKVAGMIDLSNATQDEIEEKLALIYGKISLIRCGGSYLMGKTDLEQPCRRADSL
jgi:iron complex transport system ATP-binding protein